MTDDFDDDIDSEELDALAMSLINDILLDPSKRCASYCYRSGDMSALPEWRAELERWIGGINVGIERLRDEIARGGGDQPYGDVTAEEQLVREMDMLKLLTEQAAELDAISATVH